MVDKNKDMVLTWKEVYSADIENIIMEFPALVPDMPDEMFAEPSDQSAHDELWYMLKRYWTTTAVWIYFCYKICDYDYRYTHV